MELVSQFNNNNNNNVEKTSTEVSYDENINENEIGVANEQQKVWLYLKSTTRDKRDISISLKALISKKLIENLES